MTAAVFAPPEDRGRARADGRLLLRSTEPLADHPVSVVHSFRAAQRGPSRPAAASPSGRTTMVDRLTWGEMRGQADRLAQGLLDRGLADRPVLVLSGNSRLHLAVLLAAMTVGAPVVADQRRVLAAERRPRQAHGDGRAGRARADRRRGRLVRARRRGRAGGSGGAEPRRRGRRRLPLAEFGAEPTDEVDRRCAALRREDVAKILFTSGSTGTPKGVLTTHGMLAANQQQMLQAWPFLAGEPPVLLDWLPWSHTFGGNFCLGMVLTNGGDAVDRRRSPRAGPDRPDGAQPRRRPPDRLLQRARGLRGAAAAPRARRRRARRRSSTGSGSASSRPRRCPSSCGTGSGSSPPSTGRGCR